MKFVENLTKTQKKKLKELMRTSSNFRVRSRAHVILLSARKYKIDQLASIFNVDRDTVSDWIRRWEKLGFEGLKDAKRTGRPRKKEGSDVE